MKLRIAVLLALLVAGVASSYALAKGKPGASTTVTGTTTTSHGKKQAKLVVCHKAGKSGRWVKIKVATKAAEKARLKRGDVLPGASGACPAPTPKSHTTTGSTSTGSTTTSPD